MHVREVSCWSFERAFPLKWFLLYFNLVPGVAPANVSGNLSSSTSVWISWDRIADQNTNGILLGYIIIYKLLGSSSDTNLSVGATVTRLSIDQLRLFSDYEISVAGRTAMGAGNFSRPLILKTGEGGVSCSTFLLILVSGCCGCFVVFWKAYCA